MIGTHPHPILYVVPSAGIGGAETFIQHAALFHNRNEFSPLFCLLRDGALGDWFRKNSIPNFWVDPHPSRLSHPNSLLRTVRWISAIAKNHHASLIHSTMAYGALFGAPASKLAKIPHLWFQHGPVSGWMDLLAEALPCELILTNSTFTMERQKQLKTAAHRFLLPERKKELFGLGVDFETVKKVSAESIQKQEKDFVAGILCRLQEWKGVHIFIEAIAEARKTNPEIRGIIFSGTADGSKQDQYEKKVRKLALETKSLVSFVGHTATPLQAMLALDVVVNASITPEPFGLTIIEAMAMGRVPIAPREGGPLDIIEDGINGLFFTPRNPKDLAEKILHLAENSEFYHRLSTQANQTAQSQFDARKSIAKLEQIYSSKFMSKHN